MILPHFLPPHSADTREALFAPIIEAAQEEGLMDALAEQERLRSFGQGVAFFYIESQRHESFLQPLSRPFSLHGYVIEFLFVLLHNGTALENFKEVAYLSRLFRDRACYEALLDKREQYDRCYEEILYKSYERVMR